MLLTGILEQFIKTWNYYPFDIIASSCALIVLMAYLFRKKETDQLFMAISIYAIVVIVFEVWNNLLALQRINNFITYYFFFIAEGFLLAWFYRSYFAQRINKAKLLLIDLCIIGVNGYGILNFFFIDTTAFNSSIALAQGILLIVLSLSYLLEVFQNTDTENLLQSPRFVISAGILMYFSGTLFAFTFAKYFVYGVNKTDFDPWHIITALVIIFRLILSWGIWITGKYER
jgi:hypothetical protein